jgi:transmembrane sensor
LAYFRFGTPGDRYMTPIGGVASVPLQDGSTITLNTRTQVRVELGPRERRIELDQGEAFFQVAKDPRRPFVVRAGDKRIVAVGTQFSVRRNGDDVRVVVTEGTVRLESDGRPMQPRSFGADTRLTAGSVARARDKDLLVQSEPLRRAEEILSWRQGYLTFHDTPLGEALAEFNRYNLHQIDAADAATAAIQISGMFRPTNYQAFVRLLEEGYALEVRTSGDHTVLRKE